MELAVLALAGTATALATGVGALPVSRLGEHARTLRPAMWGLTVGLMTVASIVGLLLPATREGDPATVATGLVIGVVFLLASRRILSTRDVHVGQLSGAGVRRSLLVFGVLFVHSLPEGLAIGTAYASKTDGLGLFVILAIALQNIPEGTSVAIPMDSAGFRPRQQFWAAVLTSAPQPVGAVVAYLLVEQVHGLLPFSFSFAAGAMLCLVAVELAPDTFRRGSLRLSLTGTAAGGLVMLGLAAALGV